MFDLKVIKEHWSKWNKKTPINVGNNKEYKIIGCGGSAFKVIKYEPQEELGNKGGWSQVFWNYDDIDPDSIAAKVVQKMQKLMTASS